MSCAVFAVCFPEQIEPFATTQTLFLRRLLVRLRSEGVVVTVKLICDVDLLAIVLTKVADVLV